METPVYAHNEQNHPLVVIRSRDSGCHVGYLKSRKGSEVELTESRRLWYWSGAATLSQLAVQGVKNAGECKFTIPISITVLDVCEIIPTTEKAKSSIDEVPEWVA